MWYLLILPALTIFILLVFFRERTTLWELGLPLVASLFSIAALNKACDYTLASDEEFHGGNVISTVWDQHWTERYTTTYTDKRGSHTTVHYRYHPDRYKVVDSNGYEIETDHNDYKRLKDLFGNEKSETPWRIGKCSWGDGHIYTSTCPQTIYIPCLSSHRYENRVARSNSIFNFKDVDPKPYGLFEYPSIENYYSQRSILGVFDPQAEDALTKFNCQYGKTNKVRVFILVFKNASLDAAIAQQHYWKNGNKNEVVICIGTDPSGSEIQWVYPFCWSNERLKVDLREDISDLKVFEIKKIVAIATELVRDQFKIKNFDEFEYLTLDPPWWMVALCATFNIALNFGILYWVVNNEYCLSN